MRERVYGCGAAAAHTANAGSAPGHTRHSCSCGADRAAEDRYIELSQELNELIATDQLPGPEMIVLVLCDSEDEEDDTPAAAAKNRSAAKAAGNMMTLHACCTTCMLHASSTTPAC